MTGVEGIPTPEGTKPACFGYPGGKAALDAHPEFMDPHPQFMDAQPDILWMHILN